ncbi:MAG: prepilin peptidase, partial [Clostridiales bacterium]|nr:prepilin peptidase [Clostridiales bacterium]
MHISALPLPFVIGAFIGSFLNVCIYRIPRGISVAAPRSFCPGCGKTLSPLQLVPLASFFLHGGKCARCGGRIS